MEIEVLTGPNDTPLAVAALREAASAPAFHERLALNHREAPPDPQNAGWGIYPWWKFEGVRVDFVNARYVYTFRNSLTGEPADWIVVPWEAGGAPQFEMVTQTTVTVLMIKARTAWRDVAGAFMDRLRTGAVPAVGRVGSPLSPIRPIPADAWTSLVVADWGTGVAKVAGDEQQVIYGIHIAEAGDGPSGPSSPRKRGRPSDHSDLVRAIIRDEYPEGPPPTSALAHKELLNKVVEELEKRGITTWCPSPSMIARIRNSWG